MIDLGVADARARADEIREFLALKARAGCVLALLQ
jgi:hypothetical protein